MTDRKLPKVIVAGLVKRGDKYLLIKEQLESGRDYWIIPGGTVEFGERLEDALHRELVEELGIGVDIEHFLFHQEAIFPDYNYHTVIFFYLVKPLALNFVFEDKIKEHRWVTQKGALELKLVESARSVFEKL